MSSTILLQYLLTKKQPQRTIHCSFMEYKFKKQLTLALIQKMTSSCIAFVIRGRGCDIDEMSQGKLRVPALMMVRDGTGTTVVPGGGSLNDRDVGPVGYRVVFLNYHLIRAGYIWRYVVH